MTMIDEDVDYEIPEAQATGTSLAVAGNGAGELASIPDDGFGESIPFEPLWLRINRSLGTFRLDGSDEVPDHATLIPRGAHRAQRYFANKFDPKNPQDPSCQSHDARVGQGFLDMSDQTVKVRSCIGCPKRGFGAGYCTELMTMVAWYVEAGVPVLVQFQNQEINQRKGQLTLAVNGFRSLGLQPSQAALTLGFEDVAGASYKNLTIGFGRASEHVDDEVRLDEIQATLDTCWTAYETGRQAHIQSLAQELSA